MKIRSQLFVMIIAVLLPMLLATGMALEKIREGERQAAFRGLQETVRATALIVDREVQSSISALKVLGNSDKLQTGDLQGFYAEATELNQMPDVWTFLLDESGRQVINTVLPYGSAMPTELEPEDVQKVLATRQPLVTDLYRGPATGELLTTIYVPAKAGPNRYVLAQAFSVDYWKNKALQQDLPADWIVAVIDRHGKFISRNMNAAALLGKNARPELVAAAASSETSLIRHHTLEGTEVHDAFTHSELTGWTIAVAAPVATVEAAARHAMRLATLGMFLAVGAAMLAVLLFGRSVIRALESVSRSALSLGKGQKPVVLLSGIEEIDLLNRDMLNAAEILEREHRYRVSAETERERLLHNETRARELAQAENVAKDQFLAMLGHELRNPLAAISGATALLQRSVHDEAMTARSIAIINRQNRHLTHIVNDLLEVSRLMAGKIELEARPIELADCVGRCVEALRTTERAAGHQLLVEAEPVWVTADLVRMDQILNNLLTNALKFSQSGAAVQVSVKASEGRALVTVTDTGSGISAELLPHVFEPFVQGPPPVNRAPSGLGIGLALVRQLVRLHGGEVTATSGGAAQGSVFTFWLPAIEAPAESTPSARDTTLTLGKLVYVEDNEDARLATAELLRCFGYEVIEVVDGKGTLPAVKANRPDAVLMDIGLPDMTGYEVAQLLKADPQTRGVPLVALTGYGQIRDKQAAALAGFVTHLIKPVDPDELIRTIEKVLRAYTTQTRSS